MNVEVIIVLVALVGMLAALIMDKMRPGMILFSVVVLFLCTGILSPKEMLEGFSNKGMITVAMLFLVSEGIRQSGALTQVIKKLLPQEKTSVFKAQIRMLPSIAFISAFLNNTPVVVIFAPIIKRWASSVKLPATYFLIPLSYVTILGGICTLIGTSTNLVVHSMIQEAGLKGFSMFELGKVGVFIAIAGIIYLFLFSSKLLPSDRPETSGNEEEEQNSTLHLVEAVIGPRFPGINKRVGDFNFKRHYGAEIKELRRSGHTYTDLGNIRFREGDTLVVLTDDSFIRTWGESSVFLMLANGKDYEPAGKKKRWFALILLLIMIIGATIGELPAIQRLLPEGIKLDMFFFVSITADHHGMDQNIPTTEIYQIHFLGYSDHHCLCLCHQQSHGKLGSGRLACKLYHRTQPQSRAICPAGSNVHHHQYLYGADHQQCRSGSLLSAGFVHFAATWRKPHAFLCRDLHGASASFSTPIGYQTNLIVQGIGNYKFTDFVRIGLPLNIITFLISVFVIPQIWSF